ncbi:hypothetical protein KP509_04G037700 [Ceratopteris richardii]|uniref:Nodulin-like domain-containing protein n=1 Tax=Ceratopteris richardii TaxID=49495 RepID=A0A8T2UZH4_CERRI|nr:hypothetical protein KP509_04G037700 [Ceratopteris richardii]
MYSQVDVMDDETTSLVSPLEVESGHPTGSFTKVQLKENRIEQVNGGASQINRWMGLSAAMIMMACNGLTYTYAVYSEFVKQKLHYSQERTDELGAAKDFGAIFGLVSGLCYFLFPPWMSILIGALMHLLGYAVIFYTLTGKLRSSFWFLCISSAVGTGGDNFVDTVCIMIILENFGSHKGTAVGILKSQLGLSAAIFVAIYEAFLESKVPNFLFLITVVPSIVYVVLAFLIRPYPCNEETDQNDADQRFKLVSIFVIILGCFLMGVMILEGVFEIDGSIQKFFAISTLSIMGIIFMAPLIKRPLKLFGDAIAVLFPSLCMLSSAQHHTHSDDESDGERIIARSIDHAYSKNGNLISKQEQIAAQVDSETLSSTLWDSLFGIDFWLITFVVSSGAGSGLAIMNNFAQIGKAVRSDVVDEFVGIISIWSCFGRLVSGYGSDLLMKMGLSRPICLLISQMAMFICCLILATGSTLFLFIGSAVVGLAYGSYWTLAPTIIAEVFGLKQVATLYKLLGYFLSHFVIDSIE